MAKIAVISDVHSNLSAIEAVKADIDSQGIVSVFCLGDTVGYGPFPLECLKLVTSLCPKIVKGNHEDCVCNVEEERELNIHAREGVQFSRKKLSPEIIKALSELPEKITIPDLDMTLCHGSYTEPCMWNYIDSPHVAKREIQQMTTRLCCVGHTHNPFVFGSKKGLYKVLPDDLVLDADQKFLINVGSVGQPRDGDCRACYGVFEFGEKTTFNLRRVFYDIAKTEKAMQIEGIDTCLSDRLFKGV